MSIADALYDRIGDAFGAGESLDHVEHTTAHGEAVRQENVGQRSVSRGQDLRTTKVAARAIPHVVGPESSRAHHAQRDHPCPAGTATPFASRK